MPEFFLTIDASSVYTTDAPILEILVNGAVVSSITIDNSYTTTTYNIPFSGNQPSSFSLRFNDGSVEGGRSITLNAVSVSGQDVNSNLSLLTLNQNDSSDLNITNTDYLFGKIVPTDAEMGTPTIEGTDNNDIIDGTSGDDIIKGLDGYDKIRAGDGDDRIMGDDGNDHIFGEGGNDIIQSGRQNDRIHGGDGDDLIYSNNHNDYVTGDAGNDTINLGSGTDRGFGGDGNDIIYGGGGNDLIYGDAGNDRIEGQNGSDNLHGGSGDDALYGASGFDLMYGDAGDDYMNGGNDNDRMFGGADNDELRGGRGDDKLYGEDGDDELRGGNNNDWLIGGAGIDDLRGDAGNDLLFYDSQDTFRGGSGFDWIVLQETDGSDLDFSETRFRNGIEGVTLINWDGGAQANEISLDAADIIANSDLDYLFIAGDIGLDTVVSTDYDITDRVAGGNVKRGGHEYARFDDGGTELFIEVGLDLNGVTIV